VRATLRAKPLSVSTHPRVTDGYYELVDGSAEPAVEIERGASFDAVLAEGDGHAGDQFVDSDFVAAVEIGWCRSSGGKRLTSPPTTFVIL
jgi:hypothetical protein